MWNSNSSKTEKTRVPVREATLIAGDPLVIPLTAVAMLVTR